MPKVYGTEEVIPKVCDGALLMEYLTNNGVCNKRGVSFTYFQVFFRIIICLMTLFHVE